MDVERQPVGAPAITAPEHFRHISPVAHQRLTWPCIWMVVLLIAALMVDGLDMQLLSLVAPLVMKDLGLTRGELGPALASALVGMSLGASMGGALGDRLGQKRVVVGATLLFGLTTIIASFAQGQVLLIACRFISGLGFGAVAPTAIALIMDWLPARFRTRAVVVLSVGSPLGGLIGSATVVFLLPVLGWRGCFIFFGTGTLLLALCIFAFVPESLTWLLRAGRRDRARQLLVRMFGPDLRDEALPAVSHAGAAADRRPVSHAGAAADRRPVSLSGYWSFALCCGIVYFAEALVSFAVAGWAPIFLTGKGFTLTQAHGAIFARNLLAVIGALSSSVLIERFGTRKVLTGAQSALLLTVLALGGLLASIHGTPQAASVWAAQVAIGLAGGVAGIVVTTLYTLMAYGFPAHIRATGTGFGMMMGRLGGISILLSGGVLITLDPDRLMPFFGLASIVLLLAVIVSTRINRHIPPGQSK